VIDILELGPGILGYCISGRIEKLDVERVIADMDRKVPAADRLRLYVEVNQLNGLTPQALLRDLRLGVPRANYFAHVKKLAVVTPSPMVRIFSKSHAKITRWCETRVY
jgi:hypothetical protein